MSGPIAVYPRMVGRLALATTLLSVIGMPAAAAPFVQAVRVDHATFAACVHAVLAQTYPARARITDLRGTDTVRITLEETALGLPGSTSSPVLVVSVRKVGRGAEVEIQSAPTMRGEDFYAARTWREVQGCLPPGP